MAQKKRRGPRPLKRKSGTKAPKIKIVAFCEGQNTEPIFLKDFSLRAGNGLVLVEPIPAAGVPLTIVQKAVERKLQLERIAKKSKDPLDKAFQVWAVFDCDEHPNIPQAFDMANANNVKVAYSNPCFELWPYLHFKEQNAAIHRHDLQRALTKEISTYKPKGSKTVCLDSLKDDYEEAKKRAKSLIKQHTSSGDIELKPNPYTDAFELFDVIKDNGKE